MSGLYALILAMGTGGESVAERLPPPRPDNSATIVVVCDVDAKIFFEDVFMPGQQLKTKRVYVTPSLDGEGYVYNVTAKSKNGTKTLRVRFKAGDRVEVDLRVVPQVPEEEYRAQPQRRYQPQSQSYRPPMQQAPQRRGC